MFKGFNLKLYISLIAIAIIPTIHTTIRVFYLGDLPDSYAFSIAGQLGWVSLIYEVLSEAIILPLFYYIGDISLNKSKSTNRIKTLLIVSAILYTILSLVIIVFTRPLLEFMVVHPEILEESITYIRLESIANIFVFLTSYLLVVIISLNNSKYVWILTVVRLLLSIIFDTFLVSNLDISLKLGVNGIAYTNIIVNLILLGVSIYILSKAGIKLLKYEKLDFSWQKKFIKISGISGLESLVRNLAYMLMISRMVNTVNEQGVYWVANNFIWGWLLVPIISLGDLIKKEVAEDNDTTELSSSETETPRHYKIKFKTYFVVTTIVCITWLLCIPLWKPFMTYGLNYTDVDKLFNLVIILLGFYIVYAYQNICDSVFYGLGKTNYMVYETIVTNTIYYGIAYILYASGHLVLSLNGIALLFGFGILFDGIVSFLVYLYLMKGSKLTWQK